MFPLFEPGDRLKLDSNVGDLKRGDIVSHQVSAPGLAPQQMVHRVVGLPGERLEPTGDGGVLVNGTALVEDYLPPGMKTYLREPVDVPADHYFVMGDNRGRSSDSRVSGPIPRSDIVGRVGAVVDVKTGEEDVCEVVSQPDPSSVPPLTVDEDDPPAAHALVVMVLATQAATQKVTADNLEAVRAEVRNHTDSLESLVSQVGPSGEADRIVRDDMVPVLRAMIAAPTLDEWTARRVELVAAVNRHMTALRGDVLDD